MAKISRRDAVGLAALAAGLLVTAGFLVPGVPSGAKAPISNGEVIPTATAAPRPSPTPVPVTPVAVAAPAHWSIVYYRGRSPGEAAPDTQTSAPTLDLDIPAAPFNDIPDGNWSLGAQAEIAVVVGENSFTLEHQGAVRVFVDGREVAANAGRELQILEVVANAERTGPSDLRIEAVDTAGPFVLRWK